MEKLGPTTYTRIEAVVPLWSSGFQHNWSHFLRYGSCSSVRGCDKYWRRIEQKKKINVLLLRFRFSSISLVAAEVVSLSTSLFLLESQYGRINSNGEAWSHYLHKNRSSGPSLIVMIETQLVSLSTLRFMLKRQGMRQVLREDWPLLLRFRFSSLSLVAAEVVSFSTSQFILNSQWS